jgi:hypothetical protein
MSVNFSGIVPDNNPFNDRIIQDANLAVSVALPASATTTNTNSIDLVQATPYPVTETVNVSVYTTASANGNSVNGTIVLQHTSANSDGTANSAAWANIPTLASTQITEGASSTAAVSATYKLPPGCLRFIRAQITLPSNTANLSDATGGIKLLF